MSRLFHPDDGRDGAREPLPVGAFAFEVLATRAGQVVELRAPPEVARLPLRGDPALLLELVQRGVERSVADLQRVIGDLPEALADRPAVHRLERQNLQDQEVERSLDEIWRLAHVFVLGYRD